MDPERSKRIDEILWQAVELEGKARDEFLDRACAGDAELRREVESMLGDEEIDTGEILRHSPAAAPRWKAQSDALRAGDEVGHYRIESLIGRGGMGEVYLARHDRLGRMVALKALPAEFTADAERVRRFEQEAIAASRLNHPNIITIFEIAQAGGAYFIAAEYVEGQTLRQMMTDAKTKQPRRLGVEQSLEIAIQIANALKAAHTAWIIHRDIKPENVMVRKDGLVKVLDFGIAKVGLGDWETGGQGETDPGVAPSPRRPVAPSFTAAGTILGTANYMSPEQARGETLDGRADVFSLGATLYEMVTGERLMAGATLAGATAILRGEQESLKPQARFDHAPKELERIIRKSLRRNREERYASAGEMLDDLNALKRRLDNRASRRMVKLGALAILLAALLASVAAWLSINETWAERVMRDGHAAAARRAAFSPDGRLLVSVGEDNKVIVWDFARRERLATFNDHTDWVTSVAFSPDGKWFATASYDKTVIVWDAARLEKAATLRGHREKVCAVAFSPDGRLLVSSDYGSEPPGDNTILWRVGSWEKTGAIPFNASDASNLLFSPDSRRLIFHSERLPNTWDLATGQPAPSEFDPAWYGNIAVFSPDGERLVSVRGEGEVIFADRRRRSILNRYPAHQDNGRAAAWSPDGRLVATGAENVILWDAVTMRKIAPLEHTSYVWGLAFSPDGRWLVSTHGDGAVLVWDMVERRRVANFNEHSNRVGDVVFSRDGKRIASASEDRSVIVWDAATGRKETTLAGHTTRVSGVAFAPGGDGLASVDRDGNGVIWDLSRRQPRQRFNFPPQGPDKWIETHCLAASPDGRWVVVSHGVYESATGRQVVGFHKYDAGGSRIIAGYIYGVSFSVDGRWMALAESRGKLFLWDTATWRIADQADSTLISVSFSPDGEWLATGEDQGIVRLWSARPLRYVAELGRHEARVKSVAFSPDGREVVSASDDRTICLWDVGRRKLITRIGTHASPVLAVAFSPDGKQIVSGERDHSVRLYTRRRALWGFQLD